MFDFEGPRWFNKPEQNLTKRISIIIKWIAWLATQLKLNAFNFSQS